MRWSARDGTAIPFSRFSMWLFLPIPQKGLIICNSLNLLPLRLHLSAFSNQLGHIVVTGLSADFGRPTLTSARLSNRIV